LNHAPEVPEELTRHIGRAIRALERTDMRAANEALEEACEAADHGRGYERLRAEHRADARHPFVNGPGG
jgi:predicted translin family RNA/ssDNA-binding protein